MKKFKCHTIWFLAWSLLFLFEPAQGQDTVKLRPIKVVSQLVETGGTTLGIDQQGYHLYLADGERGLKIINTSNRRYFVLTGSLPLTGTVNQVAVDSHDVAVLTDFSGNQVHFVDVDDKMRPYLMSTLPATGGVPRLVRKTPGKAFVVQYDDDLSAAGAFSGVEIFSHEPIAESIQLVPIENVRDIVVTPTHLLAAAGSRLLAFRRNASGVKIPHETALDFDATDALQSLAIYGEYLFVFGAENLSVISLPSISTSLRKEILNSTSEKKVIVKLPVKPIPFELSILTQAPVDAYSDNRKVDAAEIDFGFGFFDKVHRDSIFLLLTTQRSYGIFIFDRTTNTLNPVSYEDLDLSEVIVFKDIHAATDGEISIYDAAFSRYQHPGLAKGGIVAVGALGKDGVGYVHYEY
jgi:hypothetical protein